VRELDFLWHRGMDVVNALADAWWMRANRDNEGQVVWRPPKAALRRFFAKAPRQTCDASSEER